MSDQAPAKSELLKGITRRDVLEAGGTAAAASVRAGVALPKVHAAEDNTIQLALIGSGCCGPGAVRNILVSI